MTGRGMGWWTLLAPSAVGAGVVYGVLALPARHPGLTPEIVAALPDSGVENPVTAVLLNFRGYDTLLEIGVLSLAVMGIWSLARMPRRRAHPPGLVLQFLVQVLAPFTVLLAAYLLWAGAHAPGGAFQAGAVLAAGLVLVVLTGVPLQRVMPPALLRLLLMLGLLVFLAVGVAMIAVTGRFLEFPPQHAKTLILAIEAAATVSIAAILVTAFCGGRPRPPEPAP